VTSYIVTKYGIANIKGKSTYERAKAIIGLAHHDFRDEQVKDADAMNIRRRSNKKDS